ncbi:MAG: hypothetical protein FVQ82_14825 [Planctomycetes bacterium]|nr:hypothetical protein [Planctomycetota bacterium]
MKAIRILIWTSGLLVLLLIPFISSYVGKFKHATTVTIDINKYGEILKEIKKHDPQAIFHFPESIPAQGDIFYFHYRPTFMQGDGDIMLWYKTSPKKIEELYERFSKIMTKSYHGGHLEYCTSNETSKLIELSKDYETMQLDEDPDNIPEHENRREVIISREKNEIIFWAYGVF